MRYFYIDTQLKLLYNIFEKEMKYNGNITVIIRALPYFCYRKGMVNFMERKIFCGEETLNDMLLRYYMVVQNIGDESSGLESYGALIEKITTTAGGGKSIESKQINNIFYKRSDIEDFMALIARNKVTPMSLADIVDDCIQMALQSAK